MLGEQVQHFSERKTYFFNCVDTSGGYDLQSQSFFREQDQRELMRRFSKTCNDRRERNSRHFVALVLSSRVQLEQYFILKIQW